MAKKTPVDPDAPKTLSTYTVKLDDGQMAKLEQVCLRKGWDRTEVAYARFGFKGPKVNVTGYTSGKALIAGKGTEEFVTMTLEPEVTGEVRLGYDEVLNPDWFEPHAGMDESGKGDFFGPVVAATVIADRRAIEALVAAGVKDSKKIADTQILRLDQIVRNTRGATVEVCYCSMEKYNELMARPRANLSVGVDARHRFDQSVGKATGGAWPVGSVQ
jgi:ribonuclease HIII